MYPQSICLWLLYYFESFKYKAFFENSIMRKCKIPVIKETNWIDPKKELMSLYPVNFQRKCPQLKFRMLLGYSRWVKWVSRAFIHLKLDLNRAIGIKMHWYFERRQSSLKLMHKLQCPYYRQILFTWSHHDS